MLVKIAFQLIEMNSEHPSYVPCMNHLFLRGQAQILPLGLDQDHTQGKEARSNMSLLPPINRTTRHQRQHEAAELMLLLWKIALSDSDKIEGLT